MFNGANVKNGISSLQGMWWKIHLRILIAGIASYKIYQAFWFMILSELHLHSAYSAKL